MKENFHLCIAKIKSRSFPELTMKKFFISIRIFYFIKFFRTFPIFTGFFSIEFYTFTMSKDRGVLKTRTGVHSLPGLTS